MRECERKACVVERVVYFRNRCNQMKCLDGVWTRRGIQVDQGRNLALADLAKDPFTPTTTIQHPDVGHVFEDH